MSQGRVEIFGYHVIERGVGGFGTEYYGITGQHAVEFLMAARSGEVVGAFTHPILGPIDLVWGRENEGDKKGYGLAKIIQKHPEVLNNLAENIEKSKIVEELPGRRILLTTNKDQLAIVDLQWFDKEKTWLVNAYVPVKKT